MDQGVVVEMFLARGIEKRKMENHCAVPYPDIILAEVVALLEETSSALLKAELM